MTQWVKSLPAMQETGNVGSTPGSRRPLEKEMATPISILAWEIPQSSLVGYSLWGRKRIRHTLSN